MRVFVAGATGVAGRRTVRALVAAGHEISGVARSVSKADLLRGLGAVPVEVDLFDPRAVAQAVKGHDAIVNLATRIPPPSRALLPGAWDENHRIRTHVSRNLAAAGLAHAVECYIQESLAFIYPDRGEDWIDEDVALDPPSYARSVLDAEEQASRFTDGGRRGLTMRFGQFYAPDGSHARYMMTLARRGISPFVGPPEAFWPVIHVEDVAGAVVAALETPAGIYNIVDDEPLTQRELAAALAAALSRPPLRSAPPGIMRLGGSKVRTLMRSQRVSNKRFRAVARWSPTFPSAREGFPVILEEAADATG